MVVVAKRLLDFVVAVCWSVLLSANDKDNQKNSP